MARQYDAMVKSRRFNIGNLVLKGYLWQQETQLMGNWDPVRKVPTRLSIVKGKDPIIWKPWTEGNWSILGMLNI